MEPAGVRDGLEFHVVPVLPGQGRWVLEGEHGVTHLRYRVRRPCGA